MSIEIKYIPLTFINTDDEILKQIKNTVLFSYLFQNFEETSLLHYLQSTQYGYTASSSISGTHQMVRITDINNGNVDWNTIPFCDCTTEEKYLLKDEDILIARTGGTTGKSFIVIDAPKNAVFASYLIRLRLKEDVNLEFINIYLNSYAYWSQIIEMKSGSAMPNVNAEKLKTLRIPKISLKEQNEFVVAFNDVEKSKSLNFLFQKIKDVENLYVDSKENTNELTHQLDLVKQLRQSFLREAMQGKLVKSTNTKETGQQLLEKIKAEKAQLIAEKKIKKEKPLASITKEEIPFEIPEHWTWCRLGELISYTDNFDIHKNLSHNEIINYVDIASVDNKNFLIKEIKKLSVAELSTRARRVLKKDYILYSTVRPYLKNIAIIKEEFPNYIGSTGFNVFKPIFSNINYLFYFLLSPDLNREYEEMMKGFNSPTITIEQFERTLFALPPLHEQEQIVAKLDELMIFCDVLEQGIKESQGYNEMLLQQVLREALQGEKV